MLKTTFGNIILYSTRNRMSFNSRALVQICSRFEPLENRSLLTATPFTLSKLALPGGSSAAQSPRPGLCSTQGRTGETQDRNPLPFKTFPEGTPRLRQSRCSRETASGPGKLPEPSLRPGHGFPTLVCVFAAESAPAHARRDQPSGTDLLEVKPQKDGHSWHWHRTGRVGPYPGVAQTAPAEH